MFLLLLLACSEAPQTPTPVVEAPQPVIHKPEARVRRKPEAKPCMPPPSADGLGEEGVVASQGLSAKEIRDAVRGFDGPIVKCAQIEPGSEGRVLTEVTVGCDGLVKQVTVMEDGGLPGLKVDCITEALYYVPFPAHDLPDGMTFQYPFEFSQVK